ncbi:Uncharacterised protein [Halioglobus japonicus]|nr:Uncharacterised protein [Halioglobus japonicus]
MKIKRLFLAACIATSVIGCKVAIIAPPEGIVTSASGERDCDGGTEGKYCTFDLSTAELPLTESFTANSKPGYQFVKWKKADGFLCGDSKDVTCSIAIPNDDTGKAQLASFTTVHLMPVFEYLGVDTDDDGIDDRIDADDDNDGVEDSADICPLYGPNEDGFGCPNPLLDTVTVDGKEWQQPSRFTGVLWEEVNAVCPLFEGVHSCNGLLNGVNISGWIWAASAEVEALIDTYSGPGTVCDQVNADFVLTGDINGIDTGILGWVSDTTEYKFAVVDSIVLLSCFDGKVFASAGPTTTGSWFYRVID